MKRICKVCKKKKNSSEFGTVELNMPKKIQSFLLTHKFREICNDCFKITKKKR